MKRILLLLLILPGSILAQTKSEITAEGRATKKVKPDVVKLSVQVSKEEASEKEVLKQLNDEVSQLEKFFAKAGIPKTAVKISSYNVRKGYDDDKSKKKYEATTALEITFNLDNKVLDAFYGELQAGSYKDVFVDYETSLSAELEKKTKEQLVIMAIADAKQKAEAIAKALGVKIIGISHVSKYGREVKAIVEEVKYKAMAAPAAASAPRTVFSDYEVQEIEEQEDITVIFEIGK